MTQSSSRREFLRRASTFTSLGAAAPWALNFAAMSAAVNSANAQSTDGYKALVCVFLYGGNDNHNTVVPFDLTTHKQYADIRTSIALARSDLAATVLTPSNPWSDGREMALHPAMAPLKALFDNGKLALAMNMGTLTREGTTLADYKAKRGLPPKLFSHNDQQSVWQSSSSEGATRGWGGRMADLFAQGNGDGAMFTSISGAGNAVFMSGKDTVQYQVTPNGSVEVNTVYGSNAATSALKDLLRSAGTNLFERDHANIAARSINADQRVRSALASVPDLAFPASGLASQLKIVARLIAARASLNVKRQVFFVSQGGFDMHSGLIARHPAALASVAGALAAFYDATVTLGVQDKVTTFTGSDFGRTLANNGDGSDHGWGSHHFVMGDAVKPRTWVGQLPQMRVTEGPDSVGGGRLLPAIGVDQYGATLASWFGVSASQLPIVLPNIVNYSNRDLGFMKPI
jgi:uncharacterized protein (DUF1501 family)